MRSPRLSTLAGGILLAVFASVALTFSAIAQPTPPNIVVIIMDDTGVELFNAYNQASQEVVPVAGLPFPPPEHLVTPNIDSLAEQGLLFRNAWAAPLCVPTRATLFTGLYGFRTGAINNGTSIDPSNANVARRLRDEPAIPYDDRLAIGKWHISDYLPYSSLVNSPAAMGFSRYAGDHNTGGPYSGYSWAEDPPPVPIPDPIPTFADYVTTKEVDEAIAFVQQPHAGPWFLWLALHAAHAPWTESETPILSSTCSSIADAKRRVRCRQLEVMDDEIDRLVDVLDLDTTTVILVGDNGTPQPPNLANPEAIPGKVNREQKGTIYEGGINVPLIVVGAGVAANDPTTVEETPALVHTVDVHATILDLAGIASPDAYVDGVSFEAVLGGAPGARSCVYTDGSSNAGGAEPYLPKNHNVAIRDSRYKLIRLFLGHPSSTVPVHADGYKYLFFDLDTDPDENAAPPLSTSGPDFEALRAKLTQLDQPGSTASPCKPTSSPPSCGVGPELAPALLLLGLRRRRGAQAR